MSWLDPLLPVKAPIQKQRSKRGGSKGKPVTVMGKTYPRIQDAIDELKMGYYTVLHMAKTGQTKRPLFGRPRRPITIDGVRYETLVAARKATGFGFKRLYSILRRRGQCKSKS